MMSGKRPVITAERNGVIPAICGKVVSPSRSKSAARCGFLVYSRLPLAQFTRSSPNHQFPARVEMYAPGIRPAQPDLIRISAGGHFKIEFQALLIAIEYVADATDKALNTEPGRRWGYRSG